MAEEEAGNSASPLGGTSNTVDDTTMEDILEKLKILQYDKDFCPSAKPPFRLLNRVYFSVPESNVNAQFYYFTSLVAWLLKICGASFAPPGQFDDPNATAVNILTELRNLNFPVRDIAPNRIRTGSGEPVLLVLHMLVDRALVARGWAFKPITYPPPDRAEESAEGGAGELEDGIDDKVVIDTDDEDEEYSTGVRRTGRADDASIKPQVSAEAWNMEVERVAPLLQIRTDDMKDWRSRIEGSTTLLKAVEKMYPDIKAMLIRMGDDLDKSRDRIAKREQTLSQQFATQVEEYRTKLRELNTAQEGVTQASQTVGQLSNELNQVTELLDQTKQEIEERESKISDSSPLMQIKDAVTKVRAEIKQMSLRIGILQHTVLHYRLRQLKAKREGRAILLDDDEDESLR